MDKINEITEREKKLYKTFQYSKRFPAYGAKVLLNQDLALYQQDMIHRGWVNKFPTYCCSRRTGKSYIIAVMLALKALLYPEMKIGLVAPVYR